MSPMWSASVAAQLAANGTFLARTCTPRTRASRLVPGDWIATDTPSDLARLRLDDVNRGDVDGE